MVPFHLEVPDIIDLSGRELLRKTLDGLFERTSPVAFVKKFLRHIY